MQDGSWGYAKIWEMGRKLLWVSLISAFLLGFCSRGLVLPNLVKTSFPKIVKEEIVTIPVCSFGRCPIYQSMDVDGDNSDSESMVIVPTTMTKGAGEIWVIDKGKVVFRSKEMAEIGVKPSGGNNGFIIMYAKDFTSQGDTIVPLMAEIKYVYNGGKYIVGL